MSGMFTTKGRHALRIMADLAVHEGWVSLRDVAERQGISRKYLEQIVALLVQAHYVQGQRGKGGGYKLTRDPSEYTVGQILRACEGNLAPVSCLDCTSGEICPRTDTCQTLPFWLDLGKATSAYLDSKTLADVIANGPETTVESQVSSESGS